MRFQKGNILLTTFLVVFVIFFALGFGYFYWQKTIPKRSNTNIEPSPTSNLANPTATPSSSFCQPDRIYVDLNECSCPVGTAKTIEVPQGGEEAVLICKTKVSCTEQLKYDQPTFWQSFYLRSPICQGCFFYEEQALSLDYKVSDNYVKVSGEAFPPPTKSQNLSIGQEFKILGGEEQSITVRLEKIENNKAYFVFSYGAAPPACETVVGCDYTCEFIKE